MRREGVKADEKDTQIWWIDTYPTISATHLLIVALRDRR